LKITPYLRLGPLSLLLLLAGGCVYPADEQPVYASSPAPTYAASRPVTSLVIVVEDELTEPEYRAKRAEVVAYLIERGYIADEGELVGDPAAASRIIRATVNRGGFTIGLFNQAEVNQPMPELVDTDILYPADPYFIFGFTYAEDYGPRCLPPRPRDYRPHPRPPHTPPPPGWRDYDRDRHWHHPRRPDDDRPDENPRTKAGGPGPRPDRPGGTAGGPTGDRDHRPTNRPQPETNRPQPSTPPTVVPPATGVEPIQSSRSRLMRRVTGLPLNRLPRNSGGNCVAA